MGPWSERYRSHGRSAAECTHNPLSRRTGLQLKGKFGLVNSPDRPSRNNMDLGNLFSPRLGLAYRLNNKTVIRTGYGIFWLPNDVAFEHRPNNDPVNSYTTPFIGTLDGSVTPNDTLEQSVPERHCSRRPAAARIFSSFSMGRASRRPIYDDPAAYAQQWNFDVQRELPGGMALSTWPTPAPKAPTCPARTSRLDQLPDEFMALGCELCSSRCRIRSLAWSTVGALAQPTVAYGQLAAAVSAVQRPVDQHPHEPQFHLSLRRR